MLIFKVFLNGKLVTTAGAPDLCVLSQIITAVGRLGPESQGAVGQREGMRLELSTGGVTSREIEPSKVHHTWLISRDITIGDEITLQICEGTEADKPLLETPP